MRLLRSLKIRPGEEGITALVSLHSLGKGAATVFLGTAAHALFLGLFSADLLPYAFVATAVVTAVTGIAFRRLRVRLSFPTLILGILVALLVVVGTFQGVLLTSQSAAAVFGLLILARLVYFAMDLEFWAVTTALFDVRQGKRLFGLVGTGESVARILGALSIPFLTPLIGVERLILVSFAGIFFCLVVQIVTFRRHGDRLSGDDAGGEDERIGSQARKSRRRRYVTLISGLVFFGVLGKYLVDFAFLHQAQDRLGDAAQIAAFLGWFLAATEVLSLLVRIFVSGRLLGRFGVGAGLVVLPASQLAATALLIGAGLTSGLGDTVFWLVVATQGLGKVFKDPIDSPSLKVLYQPLRANERLSAQITIEMIVHPVTTGIAGALMLAAIPYQPVAFGFLLGVTFLLWMVAVIPTFRAYSTALVEAVRKRTIDEGEVLVADRQSLNLLRQKLDSDHPGDVIFALDFLERVEDPELSRILIEALESPHLRVRRHALARLEVLDMPGALSTIRRRAESATDPEEQREALRVLAAREDEERLPELLARLDSAPPELRGACAAGLLRRSDGTVEKRATAELWELLESEDAFHRLAAARAVGDLGPTGREELLYRVLDDADPHVRRAALAAAGRAYSPALWPGILENMISPVFCSAATTAVLVAGRTATPQIDAALRRDDLEPPARRRLVRLCGRLRGASALTVLRSLLHEPDQGLRHQVLRSLALCRYRARSGRDRDDVLTELRREARESAWRFATLADLAGSDTHELLPEALERDLQASRRRIFLLLSFVYDPATLLGARDSFSHRSRERRAYALEILDVTLARDLKAWLLPLFEEIGPQERVTGLRSYFPQEPKTAAERLREIVTAPSGQVNIWTRSCALVAVGRQAEPSYREALENRSDLDRIPLTRETSHWALARIRGDEPLQGDISMSMPTMEKVMVLKSVSIFADTSEEVLAEAAAYLEEVEVPAGEPVFSLGEVGDSMYIVIRGRVRCHIGERLLTDLGEREIFGELAVLDPEPRSATVTALENTHLFRLGRDAFFELVADHVEVARGVFQVLCRRLRRATA